MDEKPGLVAGSPYMKSARFAAGVFLATSWAAACPITAFPRKREIAGCQNRREKANALFSTCSAIAGPSGITVPGSSPLSLDDARRKIESRRQDYNHFRTRSSLGDITPVEFASQFAPNP